VATYLNLAQIILAVALVVMIMLQTKGAALGGVFGGSNSAAYQKRHGLQKTVFNVTVGLAVVFFVLVLLNVMVVSGQ